VTPRSHSALHRAAAETSRYMSAQLRSETRAAGWPDEITRGVHVKYHPESGFTTHVHPAHKERALDLEYGTPGQQPTYALRRFANRDSDRNESEQFFLGRFYQHLGGDILDLSSI
jgi:hypothetical protein